MCRRESKRVVAGIAYTVSTMSLVLTVVSWTWRVDAECAGVSVRKRHWRTVKDAIIVDPS